jgi:hypothetical protein
MMNAPTKSEMNANTRNATFRNPSAFLTSLAPSAAASAPVFAW